MNRTSPNFGLLQGSVNDYLQPYRIPLQDCRQSLEAIDIGEIPLRRKGPGYFSVSRAGWRDCNNYTFRSLHDVKFPRPFERSMSSQQPRPEETPLL
jgi:hypothetical protein